MNFLTQNELRVWSRRYRGRQIWYAYDPIREHKHHFNSEEDLRVWLDQRYYE